MGEAIATATATKPSLSKASPSFRLRSHSLNSVRLRRVFDLFDSNTDGEITVDELCQALNLLGLEADHSELADTVSSYFKPGREGLDFDDFAALHRSLGDALFGAIADDEEDEDREDEEDLKEAFRVFDEDGDGFISAVELQVVLRKLGLPEGGEIRKVENMICSVDRNADGKVDFNEFKDMMKNLANLAS